MDTSNATGSRSNTKSSECNEMTSLLQTQPNKKSYSFQSEEDEENESKDLSSSTSNTSLWWKSNLFAVMPIIFLFLLIVYWIEILPRNPSILYELQDGNRIYLKNYDGNYLRILSNGTSLMTHSYPWITGSTLRVEKGINHDNCWYIRSKATDKYLGYDSNSQIILANTIQKDALCFIISKISRNSTYITLKATKLNRWLSISSLSSHYPLEETLGLIDSLPSKEYPATATTADDTNHLFIIEHVPFIQGVNLGGWFIPEVWMNPSLFDGSGLGWGGSLCKLVNQSKYLAEEKMRKHLSSWITEKDIKMIKEYGFNSVRVPLGYWNIIPDPYERYAPLDPEISHFYLNWLFNITQKYNLTVILDLHGAPGSQNGIDHSGCSGMSPTWLSHDNINLSYQTIDKIMKLYSHNMNFIGIELLNEPNIEIELHHTILFEYYTNCYEIIRKYHSSIYILYNELYSQYFHIWRNEFLEPKYYNMIIDWHLYHWQDYYQSYTTQQHLHDIQQWKELINNYSQWNDNNIIIGEWSMSSGQYLHIGQEFVTETIRSFSHATWCVGWYVWNWKIDQTKLITSTSNNSLLAQQQQQQQSHHQYDEWDVSYQSTLPNGLRIPFV